MPKNDDNKIADIINSARSREEDSRKVSKRAQSRLEELAAQYPILRDEIVIDLTAKVAEFNAEMSVDSPNWSPLKPRNAAPRSFKVTHDHTWADLPTSASIEILFNEAARVIDTHFSYLRRNNWKENRARWSVTISEDDEHLIIKDDHGRVVPRGEFSLTALRPFFEYAADKQALDRD